VRFIRQNEKGLTLIEVLIAMAILSIALTAVIKSASQNIRSTLYLQNRTIATLVGTNIVNSIRMGLIRMPGAPDQLSGNDQTLGQPWTWKAAMNVTPNPRIRQIIVDVYHQPDDKRFAHMESYVYASQS
jgi:general secretion pathway protein I